MLIKAFAEGVEQESFDLRQHPLGQQFIPVFFITVACGILSGFHGSQSTLISRTITAEKEGRGTFYNMMILEGFIALCWAAGAMILFNHGVDFSTGATAMVNDTSLAVARADTSLAVAATSPPLSVEVLAPQYTVVVSDNRINAALDVA